MSLPSTLSNWPAMTAVVSGILPMYSSESDMTAPGGGVASAVTVPPTVVSVEVLVGVSVATGAGACAAGASAAGAVAAAGAWTWTWPARPRRGGGSPCGASRAHGRGPWPSPSWSWPSWPPSVRGSLKSSTTTRSYPQPPSVQSLRPPAARTTDQDEFPHGPDAMGAPTVNKVDGCGGLSAPVSGSSHVQVELMPADTENPFTVTPRPVATKSTKPSLPSWLMRRTRALALSAV